MTTARGQRAGLGREVGQASLLLLGMLAALLAGTLVLFGFGQALGARGKHQRAADLAAVSGAQAMSRHYQRLFEPAVLEDGSPNPRHLSNEEYLALARAAALRGARRNGVAERPRRGGVPRWRLRAHANRGQHERRGEGALGRAASARSGSPSKPAPPPRSHSI